jgi:predicted secreted Zn-dependent protease
MFRLASPLIARLTLVVTLLCICFTASAAGRYLAPDELSDFPNSIEGSALQDMGLLHAGELDLQLYPIHGSDGATLASAMLERGPVDNVGERRFALLFWHIKWEWHENGRPRVRRTFEVTHTSELKLPYWSDQKYAAPKLRKEWARFFAAMLTHEARHFEYARTTADAIRSEVGARVRNAGELNAGEINHDVSRYLQKLRETNLQYDKATRHGAAQGVVLR